MGAIEDVVARANVALAAEALGAMDTAVELTRDYDFWLDYGAYNHHENQIEDGSFIKLQELTLQYNLPEFITRHVLIALVIGGLAGVVCARQSVGMTAATAKIH